MARHVDPHPTLPHYSCTIESRLTSKLRRAANGCIEYTGATYEKSGAGAIGTGWRQRPAPAHRVAWELAQGKITDDDVCVLRRCDNPLCCNIDHMYLGTRVTKHREMETEGRLGYAVHPGEANGRCKLSDAEVARLRQLARRGANYVELGRIFEIHPTTASRLVRGLRRN